MGTLQKNLVKNCNRNIFIIKKLTKILKNKPILQVYTLVQSKLSFAWGSVPQCAYNRYIRQVKRVKLTYISIHFLIKFDKVLSVKSSTIYFKNNIEFSLYEKKKENERIRYIIPPFKNLLLSKKDPL